MTADKDALKLLGNIKFNPVQRNKGIDAILVEQYEGTPVLVRVQKTGESVHDAANLLIKAMKKKQSIKSFLIRTSGGELFENENNYEGITIIDSPSVTLSRLLN